MKVSVNTKIVPVGQLFAGGQIPAQNTVSELVAPSSNLHGLIIRSAAISVFNGGIFLFADISAPAAWNDFTRRVILQCSSANGTVVLPHEMYLYARMGVWVSTNAPATDVFLTYDLLGPEDAIG